MALTRTARRIPIALLAALALLAVSCGSGSDGDSASAQDTATQDTATQDTATTDTASDQTEAVTNDDGGDADVAETEQVDVDQAQESTPEPEPEPTAVPEPTDEPTVAAEPTPATARDFSAVTEAVQSFVDERELNGAGLIIVERDEGVLYHEHFGEFDENRISLIASSSKMISAGVLLSLQEQGLVDINAPISEQVDWAGDQTEVTPAQLVSNSSGLVGLGPNLLYPPYICQWIGDEELENCGATVLASPADDEDTISPDTEFRYGGAQWQVAGAVAETLSGKPWATLINEIYNEPCGLDSLGYINLGQVPGDGGFGYPTAFNGDPDGVEPTENPNIEGGAYVTTGDYGTLLLMHLQGGMCGDTQVLTQESLDTMHADRIVTAYEGDAGGPGTGYGMGWWIDRETGRISDGGAFGTVPWLDLDDGYGAYLVIEDSSTVGGELADIIEEMVHDAVVG